MDSLTDRLKGLGFKPASSIKSSDRSHQIPLEEVIQGKEIGNSAGAFVIKEQLYPSNYKHGDTLLTNIIATSSINRVAKIEKSSKALERMLFIDTETSGLAGGAGTFAFLIGIGRFLPEGFLLQQLVIRDPAEEPALLLHLSNMIEQDSIFVSFNGKSFDIPLIQNRFIMHRFPVRIRELPHIDILHLARKLWRKYLPSCTLKDLEVAILHFARTSEDVPGWMIPDIYFNYLRTKDTGQIADVVYHNAQDIVSLAALFIHISELMQAETLGTTHSTNDLISIGRIYWDLREFDTAEKVLQICKARKLTQDQKNIVFSMLGQIYKIKQEYEKAVDHWNIAGIEGDIPSCIELAMYYEHKSQDIVEALRWSHYCVALLERNTNSNFNSIHKKDLEKRINRLTLKGSKYVQKTNKG